jgi:hypothetical protein
MTSNIGTDRIKHGSEHPSMHMNRKHAPCRAFLRGFIFQLNCCFSYRRYLFCSAGKPCFGMLKLSRSCFFSSSFEIPPGWCIPVYPKLWQCQNMLDEGNWEWWSPVKFKLVPCGSLSSDKTHHGWKHQKKSKRYVSKLKTWGTSDLSPGLILTCFFPPPILGYHILINPFLIHPQTRRWGNLFLTKRGSIQLGDFGIATSSTSDSTIKSHGWCWWHDDGMMAR